MDDVTEGVDIQGTVVETVAIFAARSELGEGLLN